MAERPEKIEYGERAPGYPRATEHRVAFIPFAKKVTVGKGEAKLFTTTDSILVEEGDYPPRYYVARKDVPPESLVRSKKATFCPFKGLATYYSVRVGDDLIEDGAWSYEQTYLEAELLRDRLCFDRDRLKESVS